MNIKKNKGKGKKRKDGIEEILFGNHTQDD